MDFQLKFPTIALPRFNGFTICYVTFTDEYFIYDAHKAFLQPTVNGQIIEMFWKWSTYPLEVVQLRSRHLSWCINNDALEHFSLLLKLPNYTSKYVNVLALQ